MRLREKRLKENAILLKTREEDAAKKEETLNALETTLQTRQDSLNHKKHSLSAQIKTLEQRKAHLLLITKQQQSLPSQSH